jgi:hypothetical protein
MLGIAVQPGSEIDSFLNNEANVSPFKTNIFYPAGAYTPLV